ncbi:MAG: 50S ribosomal protein L1 [Planctomycetes bacterium]|nr:50S ribosomal protein L1 [Planctomycetota bacterium]MBI3834474.1 50S ribosomal protein L1 [Planctomycetota bacterium]
MAERGVAYQKQLEVRGTDHSPLALDEGIARLKKMGVIKADRSYKNGKKRKGKDQTVELCIHLGIDPKNNEQMLRGAISLPKGIGKSRTVIAFCDAATAAKAKEAGAIEAGAEELIAKVEGGWAEFDVAIAHPSMMGKVGKLGRVLGPQGKMPTPKAGTVAQDIVSAVKEFAAGRIEFRNDDGGNIHLPVGKLSFADADLKANIDAAIEHFTRIKPVSSKGTYFKKVSLHGTHTPSVLLAVSHA